MDNAPFTIVPHVAVHPTSINIYNTVEWHEKKKFSPKYNHLLTSDKKHKGEISSPAHRKIVKAIDYLLFMANEKKAVSAVHGKNFKFKISFITLTLPAYQIHSDTEIKEKLLNQFFVEARKKWSVINYIWRAEKQANGSLHFHILCDKFIPWSDLRDTWNRICNKLGYIERYRNALRMFHSSGFTVREDLLQSWDYKSQVKAYQKGRANDWSSPNSTDIHSIKQIVNIKAYVTKYSTKKDVNGEVSGRLWGCNYELSKIQGGVELNYSSLKDELSIVCNYDPKKVYKSDYFSVIHINVKQLEVLGCKGLLKVFSDFLIQKFNFNYQLQT